MKPTFLTYSSRSGSTFLARELSKQYDITVVPEFQCAYELLAMPPGTTLQPAQAHAIVSRDRQLNWTTASALPPRPLTPRDVVEWIVGEFDANVTETTPVLLKLGGMPHLWPRVREHFPEAQGLNIVRDGRAVVNSLLHTDSPYLAGVNSMGYGDAVWSARTWARDVRVQMQCAERYPDHFCSVRYEDLMADAGSVTHSLGERFAWAPAASPTTSFEVANAEQGIHANILRPADASRVAGWTTELRRHERVATEVIARHELRQLRYTDRLDVPLWTLIYALLVAYSMHVVQQARGWARRISRLRSLSEVRGKIHRRLASRSAWSR